MRVSSRFVRFGIVGVVNTLIDAGLFALLHTSGLNVATANLISSSVGMLSSLIFNSRYTYKVSRLPAWRIVVFVSINVVGLWGLQPLLIAVLLWILRRTAFVSTLQHPTVVGGFSTSFLASLMATAGTFLWNYLLYSRFVFEAKGRIPASEKRKNSSVEL